MKNLTTIRNSALAIAVGLLLFAEFLHPVFHNHDACSRQESQCFVGGTPCLAQGDAAFAHVEYACSICSAMFLKYCASDSTFVVRCNYQDTAVLLPQYFVFVETDFTGFPRAPPVFS
jgi:hypothetical protein